MLDIIIVPRPIFNKFVNDVILNIDPIRQSIDVMRTNNYVDFMQDYFFSYFAISEKFIEDYTIRGNFSNHAHTLKDFISMEPEFQGIVLVQNSEPFTNDVHSVSKTNNYRFVFESIKQKKAFHEILLSPPKIRQYNISQKTPEQKKNLFELCRDTCEGEFYMSDKSVTFKLHSDAAIIDLIT
jgi:hypothetical protein